MISFYLVKLAFSMPLKADQSKHEQSAFEQIEITRLAFGSCYEPIVDNAIVATGNNVSIWNGIQEFSPQVLLWLGDNYYTDISVDENGNPAEQFIPANPNFLQGASLTELESSKKTAEFELTMYQQGYERILQQPNYQSFLDENNSVRIAATWDDHDFCVNDCFGEGERELTGRITEQAKRESRQQFVTFLTKSNPSPSFSEYAKTQKHWADPEQGVYSTYLFGVDNRKVRVIVLDSRYHQDPKKGILLGETQWRWLESILLEDDGATFTIIASSIQYFPDLHGGPVRQAIGRRFGESWGRSSKANFETEDGRLIRKSYKTDFTNERERLVKLIAQSKRQGVILISGDKHIGTIDSLRPQKQAYHNLTSLGYPLFDITSSGLSHSLSTTLHKGTHVAGANWLYRTELTTQRHFGAIEFDWSNEENPTVTISLRSEQNEIAATKDWAGNHPDLEYSLLERFAVSAIRMRYLFRAPESLSIELSLNDLSSKE